MSEEVYGAHLFINCFIFCKCICLLLGMGIIIIIIIIIIIKVMHVLAFWGSMA